MSITTYLCTGPTIPIERRCEMRREGDFIPYTPDERRFMTGIDINGLLDHISPELMELYYLCDTTDSGYEYVGLGEDEVYKAEQAMEVVTEANKRSDYCMQVVLESLVMLEMPAAYCIHDLGIQGKWVSMVPLTSIDLAHILEYGRFNHHLSILEMYYSKMEIQEAINGGYEWGRLEREKFTKRGYHVE